MIDNGIFRPYHPKALPDMSLIQPFQVQSPNFPMHVFPAVIREWIEIEATLRCCPVDYVAACMLASVAGLVGTTRQVQAWDGFTQYAIVWFIIIGNPSSNKSPSMAAIKTLLKRLQRRWDKEHKTALAKLEKQIIEAEVAKKEWTIAVGNGEAVTDTPPYIPAKPVRKRTMLDSFTQEALEPVQSGNPKGVVCYKDELSGFLANMGRYSGAKDAEKAYYLSCYDGSSATSDKVKYGDNPLTIARTALSLIGGLQPDKLSVLTSGDDDGFAARFMMFAPAIRPFKGRPNGDLRPDHDFIYEVLKVLAAFDHQQGSKADNPIAETLPLDDKAATLFEDWLIGHKAKADVMSGKLASFHGKMSGQALRLALVLECLEGACNTVTSQDLEPAKVSYHSMKSALELVEHYFKPTVHNALGGLSLPQDEMIAVDIAKRIMKDKPDRVTSTEIRTKWKLLDSKTGGKVTAKPVNDAIDILLDRNWLFSIDQPNAKNGGQSKKEYQVNPHLYIEHGTNGTTGTNGYSVQAARGKTEKQHATNGNFSKVGQEGGNKPNPLIKPFVPNVPFVGENHGKHRIEIIPATTLTKNINGGVKG